MPELPEVETVRRGLEPVMAGQVIARADVNRDGLRWPFPPRMADRLTGQRVLQLRRRSKYILADLESGESLLIHLGMSGRMLISGRVQGQFHHDLPVPQNHGLQNHGLQNHGPQKHDHVVLHIDGGATVTFNDARRFGAMDLVETARADEHPLLAALGPEPLGNDFHETALAARLHRCQTPIKSALLDQGVVAGLGNIYVCEVLHRAGIAPTRLAGSISESDVAALVPIIRAVLVEAIEAGGSSLRDYRQTDGELGYFQHSFRVYGRMGEACATPGCGGTIERLVQSGRSSFHCPKCQR